LTSLADKSWHHELVNPIGNSYVRRHGCRGCRQRHRQRDSPFYACTATGIDMGTLMVTGRRRRDSSDDGFSRPKEDCADLRGQPYLSGRRRAACELDSGSIAGTKMKSRGRRRGPAVEITGKSKKLCEERRIGEQRHCPKLASEKCGLSGELFWPPGWRVC
jgi:hypothetical protein